MHNDEYDTYNGHDFPAHDDQDVHSQPAPGTPPAATRQDLLVCKIDGWEPSWRIAPGAILGALADIRTLDTTACTDNAK